MVLVNDSHSAVSPVNISDFWFGTKPFRHLYVSSEGCQILQDDLQQLWEWERRWGMSFHPEKCSILRVHRKRSPVLFAYSLKGHILTCEESTKYLGVEISKDMAWKLHIDRTVKKGNNTLGFLRRNLSQQWRGEECCIPLHCTPYIRILLQYLEPVPERPDLQTGGGPEERR